MTDHSPAAPSLREALPVVGYLNSFGNALCKGVPRFSTDISLVRLSDAQAQINELTAELANAIQGRTEAHHWGDIFENRIKALTSERDEARSLERQLSEQMDAVSNELTALRTAHDVLRQELA